MKISNILSAGGALLVLAVGVPVFAQSNPPAPQDAQVKNRVYFRTKALDDTIGFMGFEAGIGDSAIKGQPYSAQITTETRQVLGDGNHIDRKSTGFVARDTEGRTRREQSFPGIGHWSASASGAVPHVIFINDPVAHVHYVLEPENKIARKMVPPTALGFTVGARKVANGKSAEETMESLGTQTIEKMADDKSDEETIESLGTQTIEGVQAEGTRITRTIPAGAIGNDQPIQIVTERWFSPELQTVVMMKHSDPRNAETTYQLTGINRTEPDPSLFQVPADYTVETGEPGHRIELHMQE